MLHVSKPVEFEINFLLVEINVGCNINASTKENAPKLAISLCVTRSFTYIPRAISGFSISC